MADAAQKPAPALTSAPAPQKQGAQQPPRPSPVEADRQARFLQSTAAANRAQQANTLPSRPAPQTSQNRANVYDDEGNPYFPEEEEEAYLDEEEEIEDEEEELAFEEEQAVAIAASVAGQASAARQLAENQARAAVDRAKQQAVDKAKGEAKKLAVKAGKKVLVRLGFVGVDSIAATSDTASMGVSFLWDCLFYLGTLAWFNVEMIYGYYLSGYFITGKESMLISPLSWKSFNPTEDKEIIPLPDIILHGILVAIDLIFVMALALVLGITITILYVAARAMESTVGAAYDFLYGAESGLFGDIFRTFLEL